LVLIAVSALAPWSSHPSNPMHVARIASKLRTGAA
jgi:hypothetical protein